MYVTGERRRQGLDGRDGMQSHSRCQWAARRDMRQFYVVVTITTRFPFEFRSTGVRLLLIKYGILGFNFPLDTV